MGFTAFGAGARGATERPLAERTAAGLTTAADALAISASDSEAFAATVGAASDARPGGDALPAGDALLGDDARGYRFPLQRRGRRAP